jgi:uncharacterized repeat protein (TIGR01451 family)
MKPIVIRIAALVVVVTLGLLATLQAQRGLFSRSTPDAETADAKGPALPGGSGSTISADRIAQGNVSERGQVRGQAPGESGAPAALAADLAAREMPPAEAASPAGAAESSPRGQASTTPPGDPFGLRASDPSPAAGQSGSDRSGVRPVSGEIPDADPQTADAADDPRYPELNAPTQAPSREATAAAADLVGAKNGKNLAASKTSTVAAADREPARLDTSSASQLRLAKDGSRIAEEPAANRSAAPAAAELSTPGEGSGTPGDKLLEGVQSPSISLQKLAPAETQVGKPAVFEIRVQNTGRVIAHDVEIRDEIPKGTRLIGTIPRATAGVQGELVWAFDTLKPGEEAKVQVQLMPTAQGEIGSVATVHFNAAASARTVATKPELVVETTAPKQAMIGQPVTVSIKISNPGTGTATGVVVEENVPDGLEHASGRELEYAIGTLKPNETKHLELTLTAAKAGRVVNLLSARGDGSLEAEGKAEVEVVAPALELALEGPKRRYLERQATYTFSVSNPGSAPAKEVELVTYLPPGLKFVSANNAGEYDAQTRTVHWLLEELPPNQSGSVVLTTLPVEAGEQKLRVQGTAQQGLSAEKEHAVTIEGIAAMLFQVADLADPIEVGGETSYEIRVVNQGSKTATNIRLAALLPPEMKFLAAEGPTRHTLEGQKLLFDALPRLAAKADTSYRVRVQGLRPGDLRLRVQLISDEMRTAITKEESTQVYADE